MIAPAKAKINGKGPETDIDPYLAELPKPENLGNQPYMRERGFLAGMMLNPRGEGVKQVLTSLEHHDIVNRRGAVYALSRLGELNPEDVMAERVALKKAFTELVRSDDSFSRKCAAKGLPCIGHEAKPLLMELANDIDAKVSDAAFKSLEGMGNDGAGSLTVLAGQRETRISFNAIETLGEMDGYGFPALKTLAGGRDQPKKLKAILALGDTGEEAKDELVRLSRDLDPSVKRNALLSLGKIPGSSSEIGAHLKDRDSGVRLAVAESLGNMGESGFEGLDKLTRDEDLEVRIAAINSIGKTGQAALTRLSEIASDGDWGSRANAIRSMGNIGSPALEHVRKHIDDDAPVIRRSCAIALGRCGEGALDSLKTLLKDREEVVRHEAITSLAKLGKAGIGELQVFNETADVETKEFIVSALEAGGDDAQTLLARIGKEGDLEMRRGAARVAGRIAVKKQWMFNEMIREKNPLFATPFFYTASKRRVSYTDIANKLCEAYPDDFIGIMGIGSLEKGYMNYGSDGDIGFISRGRKGEDKLIEMANKKRIQPLDIDHIDPDNMDPLRMGVIFRDMFFGDEDKLHQLRKQLLGKMDDDQWERIRITMMGQSQDLKKMKRYGFTDDELDLIKSAREVLYTPPTLQEMRRQYQGETPSRLRSEHTIDFFKKSTPLDPRLTA